MGRQRLSEYERKRDFRATPEPAPAEGEPGRDARFVIQEHHARRLHWDLRLERDDVLVSWAVPNGIPDDPARNRKAVRTEDHPLEYLGFEGEIPAGEYGAGTVTVWDRGTYECHKFREDEVIVTFHGDRLQGRYALFRAGRDPKDWMIHRMDPAPAGRDPMPEHLAPMLARLGRLPADEERWGFEVKWDGVRALAYCEPGRIRLESRSGNDITSRYPEVRDLRAALGARSALLDGEIVAFGPDGRPSFERLQRRMHVDSEARVRRLAREAPVAYVIFDLLYLDGETLLSRPYEDRRARLEALGLEGPAWQAPAYRRGEGGALLEATKAQGLEGVVAKRLDSPYEPGRRSPNWVKVKNVDTVELAIGGWIPGQGRRRERIGALLVGERLPDGSLRYAGRVGTGFTEDTLADLARRLAPLERPDSPFDGRQPPRGAVFVEPRLTAEVTFREWTASGTLRAPAFKGLREERPVLADGTVEVGGRRLKLTNRAKVMYPATGFTKGDVMDYYAAVAPVLLPHLAGRPLTLKRYPDGVEGEFFYEKQCPSHRPDWVRVARVATDSRKIDFCVADELATLVWLANLADLELHTSLARAEDVSRPTMIVFDLDPGPDAGILDCAEVAVWLRDVFAAFDLQAFVKSSGSKGLHVQVPLNGEAAYDQTKPFAKAVAELMEKHHGDRVVSRMTKRLREGRVLVDWSQNSEHKTTVCAYSLRARERPTVSTPLAWPEVEEAVDRGDEGALSFEAGEVLERVAEHGDLLAPVATLRQALPSL